MGLDDRAAYRQPHAHALSLRRIEGVEEAVGTLPLQSRARILHGDQHAVSEAAKRGFEVFRGAGNCATCHSGYNFTDNGFHNIGVKDPDGHPDLGRYNERKVAAMKGAFKTPTLRNVALTAPYMHNGCYKTLQEVVDHYDRGGDVHENLSPDMKPLHLTAEQKGDLVAFLESLTGSPKVTVPQLPQ